LLFLLSDKLLDAEIREGVEDLQKHGVPVLIRLGDVVDFDPTLDKTRIFILAWRNYWQVWNRQAAEKTKSMSQSAVSRNAET